MMTKQKRTESLVASLQSVVERAAKLEADARAERLEAERALKLARGTGDVREQAAAAVKAVQTEPLATRIEAALRGPDAPLTFAALRQAVHASPGAVSTVMRALRKANKVYNLGTDDHPRWIWILGDGSSTSELNAHVERLISLQPLTWSQLSAATGARRGRLSGAIVALQRNPETRKRLENRGDDRSFVWFLR